MEVCCGGSWGTLTNFWQMHFWRTSWWDKSAKGNLCAALICLPGWRVQQASKPSRHRSTRYTPGCIAQPQSNPLARGCQLQLLELAWPGQLLFVIAYRCLQGSRNQLPPGHCLCLWMKLMPNRIYITEPPFSCCVYCSCCDKCYRCLSLSLSVSLSLVPSFSGCVCRLQFHSSI